MKNMRIIGQEKIKKQIDIIKYSDSTNILVTGPSGYGKTKIADYIGFKFEKEIRKINCSFLNTHNFLHFLVKSSPNQIIFLDEIHALAENFQEMLYTYIDDGYILLKNNRIPCNRTVLIGATTEEGVLNKPLLNRFSFRLSMDKYSQEDLGEIMRLNIENHIDINQDILIKLVKIGRGNPRETISVTKWINSYCLKNNINRFEDNDYEELLNILDISRDGYTKQDREYLNVLSDNYGQPISIKNLSSILKISQDTIINIIEPFLLEKQKITITSRGRSLNSF
jgi:holliday junction DNA helicase RuvB